MRRFSARGRMLVVTAAIAAIAAGACAVVLAANSNGKGAVSGRVRLTLRLTGPPPEQQAGGLTGARGRTPGGPSGAAPARHGIFTMAGAFRDRGTAIFRLPSLGSPSQESTARLHSTRGSLRLALSGGGSTTGSGGGEARWRVISGSGRYAGASGSGTLTPTPRVSILVGALSLRVH